MSLSDWEAEAGDLDWREYDAEGTNEATLDALTAGCIGGGNAYVGHGNACVLLAFTQEVGWWRNSVWFTPDEARRLAAVLIQQAAVSEEVAADE